jgi:hypothetical protein
MNPDAIRQQLMLLRNDIGALASLNDLLGGFESIERAVVDLYKRADAIEEALYCSLYQ